MKKFFLRLLLALLLSVATILILPITAKAQSPGSGRLGAGVVIGAPTAITGKYWMSNDEAVDFGLSFWGYRWTTLYGDYHWYFDRAFGNRNKFVSQLTPYVGVGGGITFWSERRECGRWSCGSTGDSGTAIFARVPLGVEWYPVRPPLGVFAEFIPSFTVIPGTAGFFDFGVGIRYYF